MICLRRTAGRRPRDIGTSHRDGQRTRHRDRRSKKRRVTCCSDNKSRAGKGTSRKKLQPFARSVRRGRDGF